MKPAGFNETMVYGSSRPGYPRKSVSEEEVRHWIAQKKSEGIKTVICLLSEDELNRYYQNKLLDLYRKEFVSVFHFPWEDFSLCSEETLKRILKTIEEEIHKGHKVLVHCSGGVGRTGLVLAAWLAYQHRIPPQKAIEIQFSLGRNPLEAAFVHEDIGEDTILELLNGIY